ncbi:type II toxin-antitoxin system YafQ family toxin [Coraliomargarita algicola]|uniref:Type II toxin-antitoxin system YafQ family toxin n=2 Tax=Coraliomargaritaceae TaxID=3056371 RepID=A0ABU1ANU8_9BACT|nr:MULTISPECIES: type II toxin-antitoxin system YafQ family toxin [unclassified Coraliomargarita]MDQ8196354.1 type II toxin-antitoxin system YafQ family toxin [Coraliomargarita sp. SDUM461004]WPJ94110.1 type II toxin-antitoxin system YafQ family toxin [Coraliomargarita sp. J2-16]
MLEIKDKRSFRKDYKKLKSSGKDLSKLAILIDILATGEPLAEHYIDHLLIGDYADHRECHISPDWLLIYQITETELILVRTGSHSALFG